MYKKCKVVMLPTKEESNLYRTENVLRATWGFKPTGERFTYQHLYIISDDKIESGDWCYSEKHKDIEKVTANPVNVNNSVGYYKVIAATDRSLKLGNFCGTCNDDKIVDSTKILGTRDCGCMVYLPSIPENFIIDYAEQFNEGNIITDVLVEYKFSHLEPIGYYDNGDPIKSKDSYKYKLKVNSKDNTITIKKVKNSWNREEVIKLIRKSHDDSILNFDSSLNVDKWIEENLT